MTVFRKACMASQLKAEGDAGVFEGYGSTFGVVDLGGDIVAKGAFAKALAARGAKGIKLLYMHDPSCPIGVWEELVEDDVGLRCRGRILLDLAKGRETYTLMKAGAIDGLSIGFRVVNAMRDTSSGARVIEEADLREISPVTFPMNETARISSVKGELPTEREFERWLTQDAGFSRSQARTIITSGFKSLPQAKPGAGGADASSGDVDWSAIGRGLDGLMASLSKES